MPILRLLRRLRLEEDGMQDGSVEYVLGATSVRDACQRLADVLRQRFELPSIYLLVDGRLRCQAARGYFQVIDGFTTDMGVIGRVVRTGHAELIRDVGADPEFIAATPGLVAEACAPVVVHGSAVGAVNIETRSTPPPDLGTATVDAARTLSRAIEGLGGMPPVPLEQRLARIAVSLTTLADRAVISHRAVGAAVELSGMSSAALSQVNNRGDWEVVSSTGPLGTALSRWTHDEHEIIAQWVSAGTSSHFPGGAPVPPDYAFLLRDEIQAFTVQPLVVGGRVTGLLTTADTRPRPHQPAVVAAIELLAAQVAASLSVAETVTVLTRRAAQDPLTGVSNAAAFAADLDALVVARHQQTDATAFLLLVDLDHFKSVNDTAGHIAGDRVLCDIARLLSSQLREDDELYRIGGDEFAVLMRGATHDAAIRVAERLVEAAAPTGTTVSIGIAPVAGGTADEVRETADRAMYHAKSAGRNRYVMCATAGQRR